LIALRQSAGRMQMSPHACKRGRGVVVAFAAFALAFGATAAEGGLVGKTLPPYPAGLDELQGVCIAGGPSPARICDYALQVIGRPATDPDRAATPTQVLALRSIESGTAQPRWRVTDAVAAPKPRKDYWLQIGTCRLDRVDGAHIVAYVRHGDREYSRDVLWARRLDIASGKLLAVAIKQVDCLNEGLGV
jgi:hypothetical protein